MQSLSYLYQREWIVEGRTYQFPPITLYDQTGAVLTNVGTLVLTLYDLSGGEYEIVNNVEQVNIKTGRGRVTIGVLVLTLTKEDTAILDDTKPLELRRALIEMTWGSAGVNSDAFTIDFVIRNLRRRPYIAP